MSDLPQGVDAEIFEDLSISIAGLSLCNVLQRPTDLWEMVQLIRSERAMVRGEIYRWDGLGDAYRAVGIARTIVQKLDHIRERSGDSIRSLRTFLGRSTMTSTPWPSSSRSGRPTSYWPSTTWSPGW